MMEVLIDARNLMKKFDSVEAVRNLTLQVSEGQIYGLVGPDGAGKTTTLRMLCGAYLPTSGEVRIAGCLMSKQPEMGRAQIGYLPQRFSLYEEMTVMENLRFFAEVRGLPSQMWYPRSMEILEFVGLADFAGRRAGQLSGGMKQKLGLAAAFVHRPRILLLDEPTTGVDPVTRQDFWQLIIKLTLEEQVAVLVTTPYMDEASRCTQLGFMRQGQLLLEGSPPELKAPLNGRIFLLQGTPLALLRDKSKQEPDVEDAIMFGDRIHLRLREGMKGRDLKRLKKVFKQAGAEVTKLQPIPPLMEDVFLAFVQSETYRPTLVNKDPQAMEHRTSFSTNPPGGNS
jgi:ABC-2 type transport system ATP-binding protein